MTASNDSWKIEWKFLIIGGRGGPRGLESWEEMKKKRYKKNSSNQVFGTSLIPQKTMKSPIWDIGKFLEKYSASKTLSKPKQIE